MPCENLSLISLNFTTCWTFVLHRHCTSLTNVTVTSPQHFVDGAPSQRYPDPAFAEATSASNRQPVQGMVKPSRSSPKKGSTLCTEPSRKRARKTLAVSEPAMGE